MRNNQEAYLDPIRQKLIYVTTNFGISDVINLVENIISYSLIRDEYRKYN